MPNALVHEKSPYLRQHADNPVDWLPWSPVAFEKARVEDKPIFLSIGYSTCHWCHVMAHESFENDAIAALLNRDYVCVKLDREERPDVDRIYMLFVQATTGSGGWPMSVFLTPDLKPFFGGTYFPPDQRYGRPGFAQLLGYISEAWKRDRAKLEESGNSISAQLDQLAKAEPSSAEINKDLFGLAFPQLRRSFDSFYGGFGSAPKFPRPVLFNYLLRYHLLNGEAQALEYAENTLSGMAAGGMHDQLGGGFHRYSVDERWFVPHFEKMLYDQSQLAVSYLECYQVSGAAKLVDVARRIFEYVQRDLTSPEGAFYSAEDADSPDPENPGHSGEGAFYIWRKSEIDRLLGNAAFEVCRYFGVEPNGNVDQDPHQEFGGRNILYLVDRIEHEPAPETLAILFAARSGRPRPHLDSKILTAWNGQMISAFTLGYYVLGDVSYLAAGRRCFEFLWSRMFVPGQRQLWRRFCDGEAAVPAFLDDYAALAQAALTLFEATGEADYLEKSVLLAEEIAKRFEDPQGGFFSTEAEAKDLLVRMKDDYDGAEPSGNSTATDFFLRLAHVLGEQTWAARAERSLQAAAAKLESQPTAAPQMLCALARRLSPPEHYIVRVADQAAVRSREVEALLSPYRQQFQPFVSAFALSDAAAAQLAELSPFVGGLKRDGRMTVYHCHNLSCSLPRTIE